MSAGPWVVDVNFFDEETTYIDVDLAGPPFLFLRLHTGSAMPMEERIKWGPPHRGAAEQDRGG